MVEKKFNFIVNENEANIIIQGLGELPAKISMNLIEKLQQQATQQIDLVKEARQPEQEAPKRKVEKMG